MLWEYRGSENLALIAASTATSVAPLLGSAETTVGGVVSAEDGPSPEQAVKAKPLARSQHRILFDMARIAKHLWLTRYLDRHEARRRGANAELATVVVAPAVRDPGYGDATGMQVACT